MANVSTMQPFAKGDIFAGCTLLNRPEDDHAGDGRIIQYDSNLKEKGVLWLEGTTHLITGLKFGPDGNLWAFDSNSFSVVRVSPQGKQLPRIHFADRTFSGVCFTKEGHALFGEHLVGNTVKLPLGTTLVKVPGTDIFGYGHVYRFTLDGKLVKEYATATNGGMGGFLGVTTTSLAADDRTLVYTSETGFRIYRYDVVADQQLPDLVTLDPAAGAMAILAVHQADGTLLFMKASRATGFTMQHLDADGKALRDYPLPGAGWANITPSPLEKGVALLGNFFTGQVAKFDLGTGQVTATAETNVKKSLAGIAQYAG
jgi:outer membrane protein assembly factor BamB